jgi:hypothetical protein
VIQYQAADFADLYQAADLADSDLDAFSKAPAVVTPAERPAPGRLELAGTNASR